MSFTGSPMPLREALYALSLDERDLNADVLDDYIRLYPEHAEALTEFAIEVAVDALSGSPAVEAVETVAHPTQRSPAVSRAMSRFQNRLHSVQQTAVTAATRPSADVGGAANPFASLDRGAFRALAQDLQANTVVVAKLRDRQVDPDTIPSTFLRRLSELLNTSIDAIVAHFRAPMRPQLGLQFLKADRKPDSVSRQSFEEAVRTSDLNEEQQRHLLSF